MRDCIDPERLVIVYITTEYDRNLAAEHPPQLPFEVDDPARVKQLKETALVGAGQYDMYRNLVQVSFGLPDRIAHYMVCDDPAIPDGNTHQGTRDVLVVSDESKLMHFVGAAIRKFFQEGPHGLPLETCIFGGWKIFTDIWPLLMNKSIVHKTVIPRALLMDLNRRFSSVDYLLDVAGIYTQGASMGMRRLPALTDTLRYWGFPVPTLPEDLPGAICEEPFEVANRLDVYLLAMRNAVLQYYKLPLYDAAAPKVPIQHTPVPSQPIGG